MSMLENYKEKRIDYLRKKSKKKELENQLNKNNIRIKKLQDSKSIVRLKKLTEEQENIESELNIVNSAIPNLERELETLRTSITPSGISLYDTNNKSEEDIFTVDKASFAGPTKLYKNLKEPHNMNDREIIINFRKLRSHALDWISSCPKWQHMRLMNLYDNFLTEQDESKYSDEDNITEAIVSKANAGFYEYIPNRTFFSKFKKLFTINKDDTVTIINNPQTPRIITYGEETYVCVEYIKGTNIKDKSLDKKHGYVKSKNITFKGFTLDLLSTIESSDDFTQNISSTTSKWLSKRKKNGIESRGEETSYNLNYANSNFPNPALLSDKEIYTNFERLKVSNECESWIDLFLVHKRRMSKIYNLFLSDYSRQTQNSFSELSESKPKTLLAKITQKNANVYIKEADDLNRVGNLKEGDFVKVNIKEKSTNSGEVVFDFFNFESKKYVPVICLSEGKILYGYVNSSFISFLTTDEDSIIEEADYTQTLKKSASQTNLDIKILEDTIKAQSSHTTTDPNMKKNPTFMSDKEIADNITLLNDFEKIYEWAKLFPLQTKRVKVIYDKVNDVNNQSANSTTSNNFDDNKPKTLMATVIRDKAHVYPCSNNTISNVQVSGSYQEFKSSGILKKGAKIKVALNDSRTTDADPIFVYHKNIDNTNTHYLKIQYLGSDFKYKEGFISVNAISTYTVEQEIDDILSTILSDDYGDELDFSLNNETSSEDYISGFNDALLDSVGGAEFEFSTLKKTDGSEYLNSSNESVDFDLSIKTDESGKPQFGEDGKPLTKESNFDKTTYDITTSSFGTASSFVNLVLAIKNYAQTYDVQQAINTELVDIMSSTSGFTSSVLGLAKTSIDPNNSHSQNLEHAGNIFTILSTSFDTLNMFCGKIPEYWELIKKREAPDAEQFVNEFMDFLSSANSILGLLSDCSSNLPIVSAYIEAINSAIKLILDIVKFIMDEIQIFKMLNTKKDLKVEYNINKSKEERAQELETLNKEIDKLQFKGSRRTTSENDDLNEKLNKRSNYMDIFITNELEVINKKRRNRRILTITQDVLNLTGDILGIVVQSVPEPNTILATTLAKMGSKAASSAVGIGASTVRNIKQWYRDRDPKNPKNTRNKQIKYAKITAGILNNIAKLPLTIAITNQAQLEKRYILIESHIRASGTSITELQACNGDVGKMFRLIFAALQKRE